MAFLIDDFSPIGGQGRSGVGVQMWSYKSVDDLSTVVASAYFNDLRDQVYVGDIVMLSVDTGSTPLLNIIHFATVPRSPSAVAVTIDAADINAA